jgi:hypothetical protein
MIEEHKEFYNSLKYGEKIIALTTGNVYTFCGINSTGVIAQDDNGKELSYSDIRDDIIRYFYRLDEHPKVTIETQQVTHRREEIKLYKLYNKKLNLIDKIVFSTYDAANIHKSSDHEIIELIGFVDIPIKNIHTTIQQY